jgi:hypothetical protein
MAMTQMLQGLKGVNFNQLTPEQQN